MTVSEANEPIKPPSWSIQTADWRDLTQLNHLEKICFKAEDMWPFWDLIGILTLPGMMRLKAVTENHMVGFIGGEKQPSRKIGWVTTLAVLPAYRRRGIAKALLVAGEQSLDMDIIRLSVRVSNRAAVRLYEQAGYQMIERWERYYTGGEDALVFEKIR